MRADSVFKTRAVGSFLSPTCGRGPNLADRGPDCRNLWPHATRVPQLCRRRHPGRAALAGLPAPSNFGRESHIPLGISRICLVFAPDRLKSQMSSATKKSSTLALSSRQRRQATISASASSSLSTGPWTTRTRCGRENDRALSRV